MEQNASSAPQAWTPRQVALATLVVIAIGAAFFILINYRREFFLLFTAIVLSTAVSPLIGRLEKWHVPPLLRLILIALLVLGLATVVVIIVVPMFIEQGSAISSLLSNWYQQGHQAMLESPSLMLRRIARQMPNILPLVNPSPTPGKPGGSLGTIQQGFTLLGILMNDVLTIGVVVLLSAVWILEGERTGLLLLMAFPEARRERVKDFFSEAGAKVGAYTRGLAILSTVIGSMAAIAYLIIGLPNVLLLGVLAGIFELVPLVGPLLASIPALLVAVSVDPDKVIPVIIASIIIQLAENHLVVPRVMDKAVGVSPVVSLLAFLAFGALFGFVGALLAIPLAAIIQIMLSRLLFDVRPAGQSPPEGRNTVSVLRYEAQNLVTDVRKQVREKDVKLEAGADRIEDSMEAIAADLDAILARVEEAENPASNPNGADQTGKQP